MGFFCPVGHYDIIWGAVGSGYPPVLLGLLFTLLSCYWMGVGGGDGMGQAHTFTIMQMFIKLGAIYCVNSDIKTSSVLLNRLI